jgi:hypothetical protein
VILAYFKFSEGSGCGGDDDDGKNNEEACEEDNDVMADKI